MFFGGLEGLLRGSRHFVCICLLFCCCATPLDFFFGTGIPLCNIEKHQNVFVLLCFPSACVCVAQLPLRLKISSPVLRPPLKCLLDTNIEYPSLSSNNLLPFLLVLIHLVTLWPHDLVPSPSRWLWMRWMVLFLWGIAFNKSIPSSNFCTSPSWSQTVSSV